MDSALANLFIWVPQSAHFPVMTSTLAVFFLMDCEPLANGLALRQRRQRASFGSQLFFHCAHRFLSQPFTAAPSNIGGFWSSKAGIPSRYQRRTVAGSRPIALASSAAEYDWVGRMRRKSGFLFPRFFICPNHIRMLSDSGWKRSRFRYLQAGKQRDGQVSSMQVRHQRGAFLPACSPKARAGLKPDQR
jgi:hypothetical protein